MLWPIGFILKFVAMVADAILMIYFWVLIIRVIISWVRPDTYHPLINMLYQMTEPVLRPVRRVLPPLGGLDWSVLVVSIFIILVRSEIIPRLAGLAETLLR